MQRQLLLKVVVYIQHYFTLKYELLQLMLKKLSLVNSVWWFVEFHLQGDYTLLGNLHNLCHMLTLLL